MRGGEGPRMPRNGLCGLLILLGLLVLAPAADAAAPKVTGLSAPGAVAQDGRMTLTVKVRNTSRRAVKAGKLAVLVSADRKRDARDVVLSKALRVPAIRPGKTKSFKATLTVPRTVKPG